MEETARDNEVILMVIAIGKYDGNGNGEGDTDKGDGDGKDDNDPEIDNGNSGRWSISGPESF